MRDAAKSQAFRAEARRNRRSLDEFMRRYPITPKPPVRVVASLATRSGWDKFRYGNGVTVLLGILVLGLVAAFFYFVPMGRQLPIAMR